MMNVNECRIKELEQKNAELKANNARLRDAVNPLLDAMKRVYAMASVDNFVIAETIYCEFDDVMNEAQSLLEGDS